MLILLVACLYLFNWDNPAYIDSERLTIVEEKKSSVWRCVSYREYIVLNCTFCDFTYDESQGKTVVDTTVVESMLFSLRL